MVRRKSLIKQTEVARAARGLLAAAAAAGVTGDVEVCLGTGIMKFRPTREAEITSTSEVDANEWNAVL